MLLFIFLTCFSWNFLLIKSQENDTVIVTIKHLGQNCTTQPSYTFDENRNVSLVINWPPSQEKNINHGWLSLKGTDVKAEFKKSHEIVVKKSLEGTWIFEFLYLKDNNDFHRNRVHIMYDGHNYTQSMCSTNVTITASPEHFDIHNADLYIIILAIVAVTALLIIIAQTAYIVFLKGKAKKLNRHNNLSKKTEPTEIDTTRYCSDPGKMVLKVAPINDINRESTIYEAPNIELPDRLPIIQPPQPPAISTIPRTPRADQHPRVAPQSMLASALNRPGRGPPNTEHLTFPRPKPAEREIHLANRPPLPLPVPPHEMNYEVYEEMEPDYNTYEPPPINTLPPRLQVPQKKVAVLPKPVDMQREPQKMRTMNKPAVTPKPQRPQSNAMPSTNELEQAFKRRNNVMQVPIVSIPDPSSSGANPPKPKLPPAVRPLQRGPPALTVPAPAPEETYYSHSADRQDSSDEEWTYEPLKPINRYNDNMNIYNI